jgi:Ca2+-transporting ATPase
LIIGITSLLAALLLFAPPLTRFFEFETLNTHQLAISILVGVISVLWYELVKGVKRAKKIKGIKPEGRPLTE